MNVPLFDIVNIQIIAKDRDYGTITIIVTAFIFGLLSNFIWCLAFGGITVLYRVLFLIRKDRHIEAAYTALYEKITELKKNTLTQREIRFEDLQNWLPKTKATILGICWKQLQENEVILKDDGRWIVGNRSQQVF